MSRHTTRWVVALLYGCSWFGLESTAQQSVPASAPPSTSQTATPSVQPSATPQSDAKPDYGAQIDDLIQQSNDAMNVKVQFQRSEELARQALELSEKAGDKGRVAMAMVYLESAISYQGRLSEALEIAQKAVPVARESGNKKALEQALNSLASITGGMGRYEEALGYFYECLDLAREINDPTMQYISLLNIGEAYVRSDDPDRAELPLQQALGLARELKPNLRASNPSKKATEMTLLNLGAMEMAREHYRPALNYYEQVHDSKPESSLWVVSALQGMAASYEKLGEPQKAIESINEAIPIAEKAASGWEYRNLLSALGVNQEKLGDLDAALANENKALALIHDTGRDPDSEWQVESRIAHVDRALGLNQESLEHYGKSIQGLERLRSVAINSESGRAGALALSRAVYAEAADLLVVLGRDAEAFEIAEQGRARAFLETLAVTREGVPDELTPEQSKKEDSLLTHVSDIQKDLWKQGISTKDEQQRKAELAAAENDLEAFHVEVRRANPRYASVRYPEPIGVQRVQDELLDSKTTLVEFLLGEKRSLAWVVTKDKLSVAVLPPRKQIEDQVIAYRKVLTEKASVLTLQSSLAEIDKRGADLYASLFAPIRKAIPSHETLVIVPDGTLSYLPFETLVTGIKHEASGKSRPLYLLDQYSITYAPSASALAALKSTSPQRVEWPKTLLAFGDPIAETRVLLARVEAPADTIRSAEAGITSSAVSGIEPHDTYNSYAERGYSLTRLPFTREEVLGISALFQPTQRQVYLGDQATEEAVKREKLDQYRYIHFASHGFIDETVPGRSGILFSRDPSSHEDGVLQIGEIIRLKLSADMVTLSACSTGLGKLVNGEGVLGLTRGFFYAGARNVTVSMWNVNDAATSALMKAFYARLNQGVPKTEALRDAKLSLLQRSNLAWSHPYFWAAFVLVGEGE